MRYIINVPALWHGFEKLISSFWSGLSCLRAWTLQNIKKVYYSTKSGAEDFKKNGQRSTPKNFCRKQSKLYAYQTLILYE